VITNANAYLGAALKLHEHLVGRHWDGRALVGPDPIGKIHWRLTRFVRSYLPWLPGDDRYIYLQGQAYWIMSNLVLHQLTREPKYLEYACRCADFIVESQPPSGAWVHPPVRGRRGFISTVEGVWASLGLTAAYKETGKAEYRESAVRWYEVQEKVIGFRPVDGGLAANYYAGSEGAVPNVSTMLVWLTAELSRVTGEKHYLAHTDGLIRFIAHSQLDSGELPYAYRTRPHFMCYQYNAFQFLDLSHYFRLTGQDHVRKILVNLARYLSSGLTKRGSCRYDCFNKNPETNYWTAALAAALREAYDLGLGQYHEQSERAYQRLLARQNANGSFDFSDRNYRLLTDRRSYPRQQSMILLFLLSHSSDPSLGTQD
jgi:hypothetical protein